MKRILTCLQLFTGIVAISALIYLYGGYALSIGIIDHLKDKTFTEADDEDPMERKIDFTALHGVNPDIIAWIYVPGTMMDYPVLMEGRQDMDTDSQTDTNPYLHLDIYGKPSKHGSIFMQQVNAPDFSDFISVLYGHNMRDGTMFAGVHKYTDDRYFKNHPFVYIYTPQQTMRYRLVGLLERDDWSLLEEYRPKDTPTKFYRYIKSKAKSSNMEYASVKAAPTGRAIVLSTCKKDRRYILVGEQDICKRF